jgi:hypothetical protein
LRAANHPILVLGRTCQSSGLARFSSPLLFSHPPTDLVASLTRWRSSPSQRRQLAASAEPYPARIAARIAASWRPESPLCALTVQCRKSHGKWDKVGRKASRRSLKVPRRERARALGCLYQPVPVPPLPPPPRTEPRGGICTQTAAPRQMLG